MGTKSSNIQQALCNVLQSRLRLPTRMAKSNAVANHLLAADNTISKPNFNSISAQDLEVLFDRIDLLYFSGRVRATAEHLGRPISFRVSRRMTNSGGITTTRYPSNKRQPIEYEIAIASTLLFESFRDAKPISVTGMLCTSRLQAVQRVMEHEMIHLIEMLLWNDSSCAARRFQGIANRLFGHKQSSHQLITPADTARAKFDIHAGDWVEFQLQGKPLYGYVNRITKRATVLVPSKKGTRYTDGKSYLKYYVPIHQLRKAS